MSGREQESAETLLSDPRAALSDEISALTDDFLAEFREQVLPLASLPECRQMALNALVELEKFNKKVNRLWDQLGA